jgi:hypothetical protein
LQVAGLVAIALMLTEITEPPVWLTAVLLVVFGYGQGLVMAPLSGAVLSTVQAASAGAGSGLYGTTTQIANAAGVAAIGAVYFAIAPALTALFVSFALFAVSLAMSAVFLVWMRRAPVA